MADKVFKIDGTGLTQLLTDADRKAQAIEVPADATELEKQTANENRVAIVQRSNQTTNKAIKKVLLAAEDKDEQKSLVKQMHDELIQTGINKLRRGQFVLIVDGTSSMQPFMDNLKLIINDLIRNTFIKLFRQGFSIAICVYRDSPLKTETSPTFVFDGLDSNSQARTANESILDEINNFMTRYFEAKGGGDIPEWLNSGLYEGLKNTRWDEQAATKMVFVMTDAPNHGISNHGRFTKDDHPNGLRSDRQTDTNQDEIRDLFREFSRDDSMYFSFFKLLPSAGEHFKIMDQMLSVMYDNWLSIMREIDPNALARFSSYQIDSATTRSPEVFAVIEASIMKTVNDSLTMSNVNAKKKKTIIKMGADKLDAILEGLDEEEEEEEEKPKKIKISKKGGDLRNITKRSYKRSNKNS
jgi:hypothetical protein